MPRAIQYLDFDSTSPGLDSVPVDISGGNHTPDEPYRALRATAAGNIVVDTMKGTNRTMAFAAGETRPMIVTKIYQSGTTATGIEGIL